MYIHSFFSAPLSSLIMNHLWLSSHDEYSETHSDNGYYLQVIPLYRSVLLSKCTSIHSSLHPCLPLLWIISDCLLIMSIQRNPEDPDLLTYKSFNCTELCCCLNVHPFILLCTLVFPYYESSLIVFSWWVFGDTLRQRLLLTSHSTVQKCSVV